jgi:hypothetical protein
MTDRQWYGCTKEKRGGRVVHPAVFHAKEGFNVFNAIQPLFFVFFTHFPLLSTRSGLFFAKKGGGV